MPERRLIPSVEKRLASFTELIRKAEKEVADKESKASTVTISREFGCEGYPVAEKLKDILEQKTGREWLLMDKALIEEVAKTHHLLENVLSRLGEKSRVVEDVISTFSSHWQTEHDYYRLLCREIFALGVGGNVIIVGRGSAIVTQGLHNCFHFRLFASMGFKMDYISRRTGLSPSETELFIAKKQRERNAFLRDFLDRDAGDLKYYHLVFNNDKNPSERIASVAADYVLSSKQSYAGGLRR